MNATHDRKEMAAELLKERIYATLALVAVLASISTDHVTPAQAAFIVGGTILSLWAASIVATIMSRRLIFPDNLNHEHEIRRQIRVHSPMLLALVFPLILIGLSAVGILPLVWAINTSIASSLLLLGGWSILSARALNAKKIPTIVLILLQFAIGTGIIILKIAVGH